MSCGKCHTLLTVQEFKAFEIANVYYRRCSDCLQKCSECDWKGLEDEFVFDYCPNHRAIKFNEETYGCMICIRCRKYYKYDPDSTEPEQWRCPSCICQGDSNGTTEAEQDNERSGRKVTLMEML